MRKLYHVFTQSNNGGAAEGKRPFSKGAYALGKIVWGKGWEELLALLDQDREARSAVLSVPIDCYGAGEAASEVTAICKWSHRLLQVDSCSHRLLYSDACFPRLLQCLYSCRMLESRPHAF